MTSSASHPAAGPPRVIDADSLLTAGDTRTLEEVRTTAGDEGILWALGQIHRDQGNLREAERYFRTFLTWDPDPVASYELGRIYQALGDLERARERLEFFVANWAEADPAFQPIVEDAKRRLTQLRAG